jgi:hypothetical protein
VVTDDELRKEELKHLQPESSVGGEVQVENLEGQAIGQGVDRREIGDKDMTGQLVRDSRNVHFEMRRDNFGENGDDTRSAIAVPVEDRVMKQKGLPLEGGRIRSGEMSFLKAYDVVVPHEVFEIGQDVITPGNARAGGSIS